MAVQDKTTLKTYFETGDVPTQQNFEDTIDSLAHVDNVEQTLNIVPTIYESGGDTTWRVRPQGVDPGWAYTSVGGGSNSFEVVDVKPNTAYTFIDCTEVFDTVNSFIFLNKQGKAFSNYEGPASGNIITPKECVQVVFSTSTADRGPEFAFVELPNVEVEVVERTGGNLCDGITYDGFKVDDVGGTPTFISGTAISTGTIPVREGETYYMYKTSGSPLDVITALDDNDNIVQFINSEFTSYATSTTYLPFDIPVGLGITKIIFKIAEGVSQVADFNAGLTDYGIFHEDSWRAIEDFKEPGGQKTIEEAVNEVVDLRQPIKKSRFQDLNLMIMGDSVYATQSDAGNAYFVNDLVTPNNQGTNKLYGGACAEIVRRLRPNSWTNYSNGGWTLTYGGPHFGQDIYDNAQSGNYLYNLERFFVDYDAYIADPQQPQRWAPDIFMVASCINDFLNPTEAWVTEAEISASGKTYDQYMEDTFVSSGALNDTLIDLQNVDLTKIAGALRYVIERVYRKFPKCFIVVVTPNKTCNHPRLNQMSCVRDMIWMAKRMNVGIIDVFDGGNQMIPILEFIDPGTGTRPLYLSQDGIHHYGSVGDGDQRMGRFITDQLNQMYYGLESFIA